MHGCNSGSALLVNAEVDSMGGVVDGGGLVGSTSSPRRAAIKKAQAELRQEYDVRENRRKELEFLEKGGNPLDFKSVNTVSVSVQSNSLTEQQPEQFVTSEVKGSFARTASPHGDSVESSGRPGGVPSVCEPNSGDNLMLFDRESEFLDGERKPILRSKNNVVMSEQSYQLDGVQNAKESADSAAFALPKKAYKRRNRSRPNQKGGARSSSTDHSKDRNVPNSNGGIVLKTVPSDGQLDMELDSSQAVDSTACPTKIDLPDTDTDVKASKILDNNKQHNQLQHSGAGEARIDVATGEHESMPTEKVGNQDVRGQINGFISAKGDKKIVSNEGKNSKGTFGRNGLDSESSCTPKLDGHNDTEMCTKLANIDSNGKTKEQNLVPEEMLVIEVEAVNEKMANLVDEIPATAKTDDNSVQSHQENVCILFKEDELDGNSKRHVSVEGVEKEKRDAALETELKSRYISNSNPTSQEENPSKGSAASVPDLPEPTPHVKNCTDALEQQNSSRNNLELKIKTHGDSVLEEARIIEAKQKRIAELSVGTLPLESRRKSHWDFVLEEMAWLANDFAQERLWKITAAAQISRRVAVTSRLRFQEWNSRWKQKEVAHTLAKAVLEFWHKVEDTSKEPKQRIPGKDFALPVKDYATRFLSYNAIHVLDFSEQAPVTPEVVSDFGNLDISWEDHLTEENLFYTVAPGTMEAYRNSIESYLLQLGKTGISMQEEVDLSGYDAIADNAFDEDEGETNTYYLPGAFNGSKSSKFAQKKRKQLMKTNSARSYELGAELSFMDNHKFGIQQSVTVGKRPATSLNVSFPTKRVRTASRQRVISPFNIGPSGILQAPNKTEASSGDTNSFQDDRSTLHGGFPIPNSLEVDSARKFEKQPPFDPAEVSNKPKKKKKQKHLVGSTHEHRWQLDSNFPNDQRDQSRKRLDGHQFDSNESTGLFGQHPSKKPKITRQPLDNSLDNLIPMAGSSVPSPVGSSMSNIPSRNKFIKMFGSRDRGRKTKALKMPSGQQGSGSPWSLYEEQALVVLVHDMGPNWELVSDAMNSTLQFKCIYRKPKECCERHKELMDKNTDGADSAEDSGTSQPYPSTLPGIPKGSARQLFQHLQGPMEEETLKSHFEKITALGQKQHSRKSQNDNKELKQLQQPHNSHTLALSQVCPNNLSGGPVLTPLDLCDLTTCSPESSIGPQSSGLPISNQGAATPALPSSGTNSSVLQGSSNPVVGTNFSNPSTPLGASARDGRYGIPRTGSLPIDEQQRMQQYTQILSGRNAQQSGLAVTPGSIPGTDRRLLPGGNGVGIMGGLNRNMTMSRPGFQGVPSSSMLNSGTMLSSGMVPISSSSQGNSVLRPRDSMHMMRPGQNQEHQRQMIMPEMPNSQGMSSSPFNGGLSSAFSNQTAQPLPPVQSYPLHHHQTHPISPQQSHHPHLQGPNSTNQAYAIRFAKERHLQQQQRLLQQQQYAASPNPMMPHVQPQSQLSISSQQNNTQSPPPVSLSPLSTSSAMASVPQQPQKNQMPPLGLGRNLAAGSSGLTNQMGKQRQRHPQQQFQQGSGRNQPQQRQQPQSQQQAKLPKGGRGNNNLMIHQNLPHVDPSLHNNGPSTKEGEQVMQHPVPGQSSCSGPALNAAPQSKPKTYSTQTASSSKQSQPLVSQSDNSNQSHAPPHIVPQSIIGSSNPQQPQPHPKLLTRTQPTSQRVIPQNRQVNSDLLNNQSTRESNSSHLVTSSAPPQVPKREATSSMGTPVPTQASTNTSHAPSLPPVSSEPLLDSGPSSNATQSCPIATPPSANSGMPEPRAPLSQVLPKRQLSGNQGTLGTDGGVQRQQKSLQLKTPIPPPLPPPIQMQQPQQQVSLPLKQQQQQSNQKTQILQAGNKNSMYVRPPNSGVE